MLEKIFKCYLSVRNISEMAISKLSMKVELRTNSNKKFTLVSGEQEISELAQNYFYFHIISHEVDEKNNHVLIVDCKYILNGENKSFQKFFKFNVFDPLEISTRLTSFNYGYITTAELINKITSDIIYIDEINFITEPGLISKALSFDNSWIPNFEPKIELNPENKWQFLFKIEQEDVFNNYKDIILGKIVVRWRTSSGEIGIFYSLPIKRVPIPKKFALLTMLNIPEKMQINEMVTCTMKITNISKKEIRPSISISPTKEILVTGITSFVMETIPSKGEQQLIVNILPTQSGIHKFPPIKIRDVFTEKSFDFDTLSLFVN